MLPPTIIFFDISRPVGTASAVDDLQLARLHDRSYEITRGLYQRGMLLLSVRRLRDSSTTPHMRPLPLLSACARDLKSEVNLTDRLSGITLENDGSIFVGGYTEGSLFDDHVGKEDFVAVNLNGNGGF